MQYIHNSVTRLFRTLSVMLVIITRIKITPAFFPFQFLQANKYKQYKTVSEDEWAPLGKTTTTFLSFLRGHEKKQTCVTFTRAHKIMHFDNVIVK